MPAPLNNSIALLIDAGNSPAAKIGFIIAELATEGVVNIRRAYGNWKKRGLKGWEDIRMPRRPANRRRLPATSSRATPS